MRYEELPLSSELAPFVRAVWRLNGEASSRDQLTFNAMPDGCVELIHRIAGTSDWRGVQPAFFVAGICSEPANLRFSGDAQFVGVRLWPWSWNRIGTEGAAGFHDRWLALDRSTNAATLVGDASNPTERLIEAFEAIAGNAIGVHVPGSRSTGEVARKSGFNHRAVQRWFQREIGMPARKYFRLLRFQNAIEKGASETHSFAQEAISLGYADQSHMARDFRGFAGETAMRVRATAKGPFIDR